MVKIEKSSDELNRFISCVCIFPVHAASFTGLDELYHTVKNHSFDNKRFKKFISDIYPKELTISETTESTSIVSYLDYFSSEIKATT